MRLLRTISPFLDPVTKMGIETLTDQDTRTGSVN